MRTLEVVHFIYSSYDLPTRAIPVQLGDRQVELRLRPCGSGEGDISRLSILTRTTKHLPRNRINEPTEVRVNNLPSGMWVIAISGMSIYDLKDPWDTPSRDDPRFVADMLDMVDQILPEYQLV